MAGICLLLFLGYEKKTETTIEVPLDNLKAVVIPESTRLVQGQIYSAQIGLMIADTRSEVYINDELIQDGLLQYRVTEKGIFHYEGKILIHQNDGSTREYPFRSEYVVEEPFIAMSADIMNILFVGVDNPITVETPFPRHQVKLTVQDGQIREAYPWWMVRPPKDVEVLTISVKIVDGEKEMLLGSKEFRVKPVSWGFENSIIRKAASTQR